MSSNWPFRGENRGFSGTENPCVAGSIPALPITAELLEKSGGSVSFRRFSLMPVQPEPFHLARCRSLVFSSDQEKHPLLVAGLSNLESQATLKRLNFDPILRPEQSNACGPIISPASDSDHHK